MRRIIHARPDLRDEDGATAAMFLFFFVVLMGVGVLAIDGGLLWASQRGQVADTDAGVLAAGRALAADACTSDAAAETAADTLVAANDTTTYRDSLEIVRTSGCADAGLVRLTTGRPATRIFAGFFGYGTTDTAVRSVAQYGYATKVTGVRPIAMCNQDEHYLEWKAVLDERRDGVDDDGDGTIFDEPTEGNYASLRGFDDPATPLNDHPVISGAGVVHRWPYEKVGGGNCGASPGNWGLVDFEGTSPGVGSCSSGATGICGDIVDGYEPGIDFGAPGPADDDCDAGDATIDDCPAGPGVSGGISAGLSAIECPPGTPTADCEVIYFVVYDLIVDDFGAPVSFPPPAGATANYNLIDVVGLVLRGHKLTSSPSTRYIDVEFVDRPYTGPVGDAPAGYGGPRTANLCGTNAFENC